MRRLRNLILGLALFPSMALATVAQQPIVTNSAGQHVDAQASMTVDSTGAEKFTSGNPGVVTGGTSTTACGGVTCAKDASVTAVGAQLPATLGAKTSATSLSIAPASDATFSIAAIGTASAPVNVSTATTTQIVAASGSLVIHVQQWVLVTTLADNVTLESADTGGACANPVALTGAMPFAANGGASVGSGVGDVLVLPAGKALCMLTSAATQISGSVAYRQY